MEQGKEARIVTASEAIGRLGDAGHPTCGAGWLAAWYASFGDPGRDPAILWDGGGDFGCLPLCRRTAEAPFGLPALSSPTNGHARYAALRLPSGDDGLRAMVSALRGLGGWGLLRLRGLPEAEAARLVPALEAAGHVCETERVFEIHRRDCRAGAPPSPHAPSAATRKRRRALRRSFERSGRVEMERSTGREALAAYVAAEGRSWKAAAGEPLTASAEILGFYEALAGAGLLEVRLVRRDGVVVAGVITVEANGTCAALKTFYDAEVAKFSVGMLLLEDLAAECDAEPGVHTLDLYSDWDQYLRLSHAPARYRDVTVWNRGPRAFAARKARAALRGLRGRGV